MNKVDPDVAPSVDFFIFPSVYTYLFIHYVPVPHRDDQLRQCNIGRSVLFGPAGAAFFGEDTLRQSDGEKECYSLKFDQT